MRILITWLAAIACLATAVAVPAVYIYGVDHVTIGAVTIPLIKSGLVVAIVYAGLNFMSAFAGQGGNDPLYWLDYIASWIAWLFINLTALYVWIGMKQSYENITEVAQVPFALWLLGGLVLFSWIDVLALQSHKHRRAFTEVQAQRAVAPAAPVTPVVVAPTTPPEPAHSHAGLVLAIILLLIVAGIVAFALLGVKFTTVGSVEEKDGCTLTVTASVQKGVTRYDSVVPTCD